MTHWRGLQGILNHAALCSVVQNDALKVNPLRVTPHPNLPQSGEGVFVGSLPNSGRAGVGSGCFLSFRATTRNRIVERIMKDEIILKPSILAGDSGSEAGVTHWQLRKGTPARIWIILEVGKLIVFLHLTGLVRFRSLIALPKIQPE